MLIGLERYALAEESLADGLARLAGSVPKQDGSPEDWERAAASARGSAAELVRAVAEHGLVLHTGGEAALAEPAALLRAARGLGLRAWACAPGPLGRLRFAALCATPVRMPPERRPPPVATVAGLLAGAEGPGRDPEGALDLDLLVVVDAPQLDVEAAALLTESLPDGARLVLSGDPAVLWSAGPGRSSPICWRPGVCPQNRLPATGPGPLGELVSGIGAGELTQVEAPGKEIVNRAGAGAGRGRAPHRAAGLGLGAPGVRRARRGDPGDHARGHGGPGRHPELNAALKERLKPGAGPLRRASTRRPGRHLPRAGP
ncbi:hypothetical protein Sdagh_14310 [Streptomyces daghestanicus]|uniref:Uncharacterized protein n=1 Tax=Streptomyces daghestanicus TaxID=66885 RepID=A0ABQ3PXF3_9ACTN|nr:hypothetical protein Sdagh_14310 [Streptomyces daghestanicus]